MIFKKSIHIKITSLVILLAFLLPQIATAETLQFQHTQIPAAPPGAQVMVAYMDIINRSDKNVTIQRILSPDFGKIELHETRFNQQGVASMHRVSALTIAAQSTMQLQHNGKHLMLFKPQKPFKPGDIIRLVFEQNNGVKYNLKVRVQQRQAQHQH